MAVYHIYPEKDATMYSGYPELNTGLDEIMETSTFFDEPSLYPQTSRFLIKFPQSEINDIIDNKVETSTFQSNLKCFIANSYGVNLNTVLEAYAVSGSWQMGTGRFSNEPETRNGVSWKDKTSSGVNPWATSSFSPYVTASFSGSNYGGGNWYTGSTLELNVTSSQILSSSLDIDINVTNITLNWYSSSNGLGGFTNDGLLLKQKDEFIPDRNYNTTLRYFSKDTHTIYPPLLAIKWRDYNFNTGSSTNTIINTSRLVASLDNNKNLYRRDSVEKFRVNCRPQFPTRVFQTASLYTINYYLPTSSYYAIKDLDTNEFIIDFDTNYTQISADSKSSYFTLYMNGLEPERYYQILIKTNIEGETLVLDDNYYFKVING